MCDLAKERERIDAILEWAAKQTPVRDRVDENELAEFALAVLREHYADTCPDECMRARSRDFATRLARRRKAKAALRSAGSSKTAPRARNLSLR